MAALLCQLEEVTINMLFGISTGAPRCWDVRERHPLPAAPGISYLARLTVSNSEPFLYSSLSVGKRPAGKLALKSDRKRSVTTRMLLGSATAMRPKGMWRETQEIQEMRTPSNIPQDPAGSIKGNFRLVVLTMTLK